MFVEMEDASDVKLAAEVAEEEGLLDAEWVLVIRRLFLLGCWRLISFSGDACGWEAPGTVALQDLFF